MVIRFFNGIELCMEDDYNIYIDGDLKQSFSFIEEAHRTFLELVETKRIYLEKNGIEYNKKELAFALYGGKNER